MAKVVIYHNPSCSKSRNTLALLRHCGLEPEVINYLEEPLDVEGLQALLAVLKKSPADVIRLDEKARQGLSDKDLLQLMADKPSLLNRPIVVTDKGARLCRPLESVLEILPVGLDSPFQLEDGTFLGLE